MNILAVQITEKERIQLYAKVNPLKKQIEVVKSLKNPKVIVSIPVKDSTFRTFNFDFDDENKIKKAVETALKAELPDYKEIEWSYYKKNSQIFCVITKREIISKLKEEFSDIYSIDSDVFSLLRLLLYNEKDNADIIHIYNDYAVYIEIKEGFPNKVLSIPLEKANDILKENLKVMVSGFIPENIENPILNNPLKNPKLNIAFGNALKPVYRTGVDFLHKETFVNLKNLASLSLLVLMVFIFINIGLFVKAYTLKHEIKKVKNKEKIVYMKYFGGTPVDPLAQAKGKVAALKESFTKKEDSADILNFIGRQKSKIPDIEVIYINISSNSAVIRGFADSIQTVDKFRRALNEKFTDVKIEESVKDANGKIRFRISIKL